MGCSASKHDGHEVMLQGSAACVLLNSLEHMSFEINLKPGRLPDGRVVLLQQFEAFGIKLEDRALVPYRWGSTEPRVPLSLRAGRWHKLVVVFDGDTRRVYLDGTRMATLEGGTRGSATRPSTRPLTLMAENGWWGNQTLPDTEFGKINCWSRALSDGEALDVMGIQSEARELRRWRRCPATGIAVMGCQSSNEWSGEIATLDMARKDGRGGFKIHPVLAVTGRTVGGREELVPACADPLPSINHSLAFHKRQYRAIKGHALPKGEKLGDEFAVCWMDASTPHHRHRAQEYTGPVHMGIAKNYDGNGNFIYGDIIGDVMWYEWWGAHQTRDFQYVKITEVSAATHDIKGDWPFSKLVDQGQYPPMERTGTVADVLRWRLKAERRLVRETEARLEAARKRVRETEAQLEAARKRVQETEARLAALASQAEQEMPAMREPVAEPEAEPQAEAWYGEQESGAEPTVEGVVVEMEPERYEMEPER